jgi:hypothetical protein
MPDKLAAYDKRSVVSAPVAIQNAGDGLSKAMAVEAKDLPLQSIVFVVLECRVKGHNIEPLTEDDPRSPLVRKQVLKAGRATFVDRDLVQKLLDEQQRKIDEAEGNAHLPLDEE